MDNENTVQSAVLIGHTADIVVAIIGRAQQMPIDMVPGLIASTYAALSDLGGSVEPEVEAPVGAVSVRKSLASPNHILSMIDGKPYKMLRRHIAGHGYTEESYRQAFGLSEHYPMVAPNYSAQRAQLAKDSGLGLKTPPPSRRR